jgi:hypothetical protein
LPSAAQLGSTGIGIQTSEGVVLAVEKRVTSPLLDPSSNSKTNLILGFFSGAPIEGSVPKSQVRLRPNCGNIFCGKILVPVNDRVFAKNVSQIFRRGQIGLFVRSPSRGKIWETNSISTNQFEKDFFQIEKN